MPTLSVPEDRLRLAEVDRQIAELMEQVGDQAVIDRTFVERWTATAQEQAVRLDRDLPRALDPAAASEIRSLIIQGLDRVQHERDAGWPEPLALLDDLLVHAEAIRHILRDALDADPGVDESDARALATALVEWLPRVPRREIARLAGISLRQFQRWMVEGGTASRRLVLLTRLVALLRHGWTPEGVVVWFDRPRAEFGEAPPVALLHDPAREADLLAAARRGRAQHGG